MSEAQSAVGAPPQAGDAGPNAGVFPSQALAEAIEREWVNSGEYRIRPEAIQPASIDLRLGDEAWALRCSFLPDVGSTVEEKMIGLAFQ
jgi:dCTP deaminase